MIGDRQIFLNRHAPQGAQSIIKVSNFTPNFAANQPATTPAPTDPLSQRKKLASSTAHTKRTGQSFSVKLRELHSSQLARDSADLLFEGVEIVHAASLNRYMQQISLQSGQNMHYQRETMRQRVVVFKKLAKQHNSDTFHLAEQRMKPAEREKWNRNTLHNRKVHFYSFVKALKPRRSVSTSYEASPERNDHNTDRKNKRKIVLLGGAIPIRSISSNPEERATYSPLRRARRQLASGNVSVLPKSKQLRKRRAPQNQQNDCLPWQIQREGMEEYSNIYQYCKRSRQQ